MCEALAVGVSGCEFDTSTALLRRRYTDVNEVSDAFCALDLAIFTSSSLEAVGATFISCAIVITAAVW